MKFHYGRPETHYEVWYHGAQGRVEVGLHFEGSRELNEACLQFFRAHMVEVKGGLPNAELEPWDRGWARLYETFPATSLDHLALAATARRVAAYVITLQPLLEQFWSESRVLPPKFGAKSPPGMSRSRKRASNGARGPEGPEASSGEADAEIDVHGG
jgi:hypothetical protein